MASSVFIPVSIWRYLLSYSVIGLPARLKLHNGHAWPHADPEPRVRGKIQPGLQGQLSLTGHKVQRVVGSALGLGQRQRSLCLESLLLSSQGGSSVGEDRVLGLLPKWHGGYAHMVLFLSKFAIGFQWVSPLGLKHFLKLIWLLSKCQRLFG